ncbi:MAG: 50S ribosomal protein L13 [Candidatus Aenigmatarchaeota archaeon]|nr:50S ribosomal protein L13 [Nanoarchaeota archaeon]
MELIVDATNHVAGRLASLVAKAAVRGDDVHVINAEKAVISGNEDYTVKQFKERVQKGDPYHGPFYPRYPDRILKRMIRGMLPYKKPQGKAALKRVKVYLSIPDQFTGKETIRFKQAENTLYHKQMTLGQLSIKLGVNKSW